MLDSSTADKSSPSRSTATGNGTFQKKAPTWEVWDHSHLKDCRIVARLDDRVLGWTALSPVSNRCVYAGVAEVSIYVSQRNKGIGSKLLKSLIELSEEKGYWALQSGIFPGNVPSLRLHSKYGFREVGRASTLCLFIFTDLY